MRHSFCVPGDVTMSMRHAGLVLAVAIVAAVVLVAAVPPDETLAFVHATVIDATGSPAQPDMTVIVADRRIVELGTSASVSVPKNARVVEARGKYLIPGLWDMHVHEIFGDWIPEDEKVTPLLFVANGVTGVRDMGGDLQPLKR
jgi:dihydroorotase-like cyclic amidohydrolase